ncbi:FGGY-family carbohydrate kinase [Flavisolibacter tropicus]|uniref:Sugar kinase n=1 Tax=Flavisolibacter tropicus TaxID=1492898 RepID=A0A172TZX3_9BACT|nr:FGGY family carbohydrate kinase [Flavisolibacter tropicus]ANE52651.1 sugar kinase [Flavisolibacter tropicus]
MTQTQVAYLVVDIGTGNVRVVIVKQDGTIIGEARADIQYKRDQLYPDSIYFEPDQLWQQLVRLGHEALQQAGSVTIKAVTATSQREGIVLIGQQGDSLIGLPNIDHRGREWESRIADKSRVYQLTGRFPTSLFSALKLVGIRERRDTIWSQLSFFLSISDWVEYMFTQKATYEHSQASETLLFDVAANTWSSDLQSLFNMDASLFRPLQASGSITGDILKTVAEEWRISTSAIIVKGGGDTQLAIKSTKPSVEDVVIVSGTTTPIVKLVDTYVTDSEERTWTSRDIEPGRFVFEANAGVTGLNYQRLKEVFYPNESYDVIEKELAANGHISCTASLGSLVATEKAPVIKGGFIFPAPVSHELTRSCFVRATLLDIAFSIAENYQVLNEVSPHHLDYIWACGGGMQSRSLRQLLANIIGKAVKVRKGFQQSSAVGGALLCNEALKISSTQLNDSVETILPQDQEQFKELYADWKRTRNFFSQTS